MRRGIPAAAAAAAAITFACGFTACSPRMLPPSTSSIQGPFRAHCTIPQRGIAWASWRNLGGRKQPLGSFLIELVNKRGKVFHEKLIRLRKPADIGPGQYQIYRYGVAYNAVNCSAVRPRRH